MPDEFHVIAPHPNIAFNAVLDHWTGVGDFHAQGYRKAADVLLRRFLDDPVGTANERDSLVLPILFLFRHYLEIRFKDLIVYGLALSGKKAQWRHGHDLPALWVEVKLVCEAVYGQSLARQLEKIEVCVAELSRLDPDSTAFRYPRDSKGKPMFEHLVIGLGHLHAALSEIGDILDGVSMDMSVKFQNQVKDQDER